MTVETLRLTLELLTAVGLLAAILNWRWEKARADSWQFVAEREAKEATYWEQVAKGPMKVMNDQNRRSGDGAGNVDH